MDTTVSELAKWLESVFPGGKVQYDWVGDDASLLYRVHRADGKRSEIQFAFSVSNIGTVGTLKKQDRIF